MKKDDIITLPTGEKVKVVNADPTKYKNIIVIERDNLERRVIDREKMEIMKAPRL
ncbi:bacteriocin [Lactococcus hircilactis]|uniref:Bacteriocin n=1 Tax=Lactococcus hircilactis TaxID=1494462 RepID=A0A7X1Z9B2_9LACT|nr:bacteriocin [Lactococcus hircilactis]MQW40077.1 bacteriocin [Lactococcus hircilactis]